jgi:hypothetical protein
MLRTDMNTEQLLAFLKEKTEKMYTVAVAKNHDYSGPGADPFKNFKMVENFGICSAETGILTRMSDKFSRISTLIGLKSQGKVKDESIEDTLVDLANYSLLLAALLRARSDSNHEKLAAPNA